MDSPEISPKERGELLKHYVETAANTRKASRIGLLQLLTQQKEQAKNSEAEAAAVRRHWGSTGEVESEDMGDTYLGDVTISHAPQQQPQKPVGMSMFGKLAVTAAALIGGPLAGFGAKTVIDSMADHPKIAPAATDTDTTVTLQLKK
mgnify:CR=1 FL=1|tara:strand:- start:52 stop:492 length:441 start_codon:yes stop_codon:yes gene_type:complete